LSGIELLYGALIILALGLNGIAVAGRTSFRALLEPLREGGLIVRLLALDLFLVPLVAVGAAVALDLDPVTRAGLVLVSAASCGPIGIALSRIARGDVPLSTTIVLGLGALNLVTVPIVTALLLPEGVGIPLGTLSTSLLGLAVAPLVVGRLLAQVRSRLAMSEASYSRIIDVARRGADITLAGAVTTALLLEPSEVLEVLRGPVLAIALVVMLLVTLAARAISSDPARVRTIAITINARAVALALALASIHLGDVEGLRATILAYGGLTQIVPLVVVLIGRRLPGGLRPTRTR
jgi:BASS family bile acid:Na+ symporter